MFVLILEVDKNINYCRLVKQNNLVSATVYSYIDGDNSNDLYKSVSFYYVDLKKYIYVADYFDDNISFNKLQGSTFELYYDEKEPSNAIKKIILLIYCCYLFVYALLYGQLFLYYL